MSERERPVDDGFFGMHATICSILEGGGFPTAAAEDFEWPPKTGDATTS